MKLLNKIELFDNEKAVNALLYVARALPDGGTHKVFKVLYFAERQHLATYGASILSDNFVRMANGPVPSSVYYLVKAVRGQFSLPLEPTFAASLHARLSASSPKELRALAEPDEDYLAETERECLDEAIAYCRPFGFGKLSDVSHDSAWQAVPEGHEMSMLDIATAGGATGEMLQYIQTVMENRTQLLA
ncbi:Panacea domain-containing protein [Hymenobacter caeli]|uniref:Phage-associated protein n=1 Tax=Hymenobacter caeli TaxID=2735894 RepID=A0ABX2FK92_9BACT|nr:Panacea domain-containing protein [Hymenobacter caeli]NRT17535.1 putative phage-associated protein [Hymenobacter caeli]